MNKDPRLEKVLLQLQGESTRVRVHTSENSGVVKEGYVDWITPHTVFFTHVKNARRSHRFPLHHIYKLESSKAKRCKTRGTTYQEYYRRLPVAFNNQGALDMENTLKQMLGF